MSLVEIKDFTALIDNQLVFQEPAKTNKNRIKKVVEMLRNNDYTTANSLQC